MPSGHAVRRIEVGEFLGCPGLLHLLPAGGEQRPGEPGEQVLDSPRGSTHRHHRRLVMTVRMLSSGLNAMVSAR